MSSKCNDCCNLGVFGACNRRQTTGGEWTCNYIPRSGVKESNQSFRPYDTTNELISDFKKRFSGGHSWEMPLIWVKSKSTGYISLVVKFETYWVVLIETTPISMRDLFEGFTYLDGSTIGAKNV